MKKEKYPFGRGVRKLEHAVAYLRIANENLVRARLYPIYTDEGMDVSLKEVKEINNLIIELEARIKSL